MNRRDIIITVILNVDADGAALLPGFPGCSGPDPEAPVSGVQLAAYSAYERTADAALAELPTVLDARWVACSVTEGHVYDPDTSII